MSGKRLLVFVVVVAALLLAALPAAAGGPNFGPAIFADGRAWGTKGLGDLPAPNGRNDQSFDALYSFSNGAEGQLPVAEAGPGNPNYNGGRWNLMVATWTEVGLAAHPTLSVLMSEAEVLYHASLGHLEIASAETYFLCPLLPVKE
jgi:hypothetical protein